MNMEVLESRNSQPADDKDIFSKETYTKHKHRLPADASDLPELEPNIFWLERSDSSRLRNVTQSYCVR